jgi:translation initiation factor 2 subunit 1
MPASLYKDLITSIQRRLMPQKAKIRADIDVTCYAEDGIDAIKAALLLGETLSTDDMPLKVKLVAPPLYVLMMQCYDKVEGILLMEKAIAMIEQCLSGHHGSCVVKMKPKVISDTDEMALESMMKRAEEENAEISGDEDASSGHEDGL